MTNNFHMKVKKKLLRKTNDTLYRCQSHFDVRAIKGYLHPQLRRMIEIELREVPVDGYAYKPKKLSMGEDSTMIESDLEDIIAQGDLWALLQT